MKQNDLTNLKKDSKNKIEETLNPLKKLVAFYPGRFTPAHKGHIKTIVNLSKSFDKVIIGIGSCYQSGTQRHPLPAVFREKIILSSIRHEEIEQNKIEIVHLPDFPTFDEWLEHVLKAPGINEVTHFVSGNEKDILNIIKEKNIAVPFEFLNPEETSNFEYHATDLRNAIKNGDYETFYKIASYGTIQLMSNIGGFRGILEAIDNSGIDFIQGRQTVDVVFTINHKNSAQNPNKKDTLYFLGGIRSLKKKYFPGCLAIPGGNIENYESPIKAAIRELEKKTGLKITLLDNTLEPAHILIKSDNKEVLGEMRFLKLFSTTDERYVGKDCGSSQVFHIHINENPEVFKNTLKSESDLEEVKFYPVWRAKQEGLAYQQEEMVRHALNQLGQSF